MCLTHCNSDGVEVERGHGSKTNSAASETTTTVSADADLSSSASSFTFRLVPAPRFPHSFERGSVQDSLTKWGLQPNLFVAKFQFHQRLETSNQQQVRSGEHGAYASDQATTLTFFLVFGRKFWLL